MTVGELDTGLVRRLYEHRGWLWLVPGVPALVLAGVIMVVLPPDQRLDNLAEWAFKLSPLVLAVPAVALFPRGRFAPALLVFAVLGFMSYVDTSLVLRILDYGRNADVPGSFQPVYQFQLLVVTYLVLFALLAFRLGGARSVTVLKTGAAAVLVVISGLNDLTFWALYTFPRGRPDTLDWASHITVFLGGPPTVGQAVLFMVVHLILAAAVLALPLARWVDRAVGRRHRACEVLP